MACFDRSKPDPADWVFDTAISWHNWKIVLLPEMKNKPKARGLWITPLPENLVNGQHINTSANSSGSNDGPVTLITFTAQVTMGSELYADWAAGGKYNLGGDINPV